MNSKFSTRTIVATGLGAAVFFVLFTYVKVPSPIPETSLQTAYGVSSFFAAIFGPLAGFLIAFIGHALSDFIGYGSPWWSWVIASGVAAMITGFAAGKIAPAVEEGEFSTKELSYFLLWVAVANVAAWLVVAPVLDIVMYAEPVKTVFVQGIAAAAMDAIVSGILGSVLLKAYASTKTGKGTLSRDN
ncbi:MAG: ECF-type riboflavin transporter substrate-binding protein [Solobacterium sp.]|nr:ECF-type riboflavin transporter substrate-binding protein [Solobacterium sp.]